MFLHETVSFFSPNSPLIFAAAAGFSLYTLYIYLPVWAFSKSFFSQKQKHLCWLIRSPVTSRKWISNWQTIEIFLISCTISCWCIHYRGSVTSLITWSIGKAAPAEKRFALGQTDQMWRDSQRFLSFHMQPSWLPLWPWSRGECIWLPPETSLRSKEQGGSPACSWLTCWHTADSVR